MPTVDPIPEIHSPVVSLVAAAALEANTRVYVNSSGQWAAASVTNPGIATTKMQAASGAMIAAVLDSGNWLKAAIASGAITVGANIYEDAGKVTAAPAASGRFIGVATKAAAADNDLITYIASDDDPWRVQVQTFAGGVFTMDPGYGATPGAFVYQVLTAAGADKAGTSVTWAAGVATFGGVANTDICTLWSRRYTK